MLLNPFTPFAGLAIIYGLSFPTGYLIANRIGYKFNHQPFFVTFSLYTAFGITALAPLYLLVALVSVTFLTPLSIFVASLVCILLTQHGISKKRIENNVRAMLFDNILPLTLFVVTTFHFALIVSCMGWPPLGDISNAHGPFVSLIEHYGKLTLTPGLIDVVFYPQGLHVTAATFNIFINLYPAQIVFILGAAFIALIPPVIYSLTYLATTSKLLSLLAYLSVFLPHPSWNFEQWIVGYFYNGPYACLMGYVIVLSFVGALLALEPDFQKTNGLMLRKLLLLIILVVISLLITYPGFAIFVAIYAVIIAITFRNRVYQQSVLTIRKFLGSSVLIKVSLIISASILSMILYIIISMNWDLFAMIFSHIALSPYGYVLSPSWFFDNLNGIASIIAFLCAIHQLLRKKRILMNLLYLCLMIMSILSLNSTIHFYFLWSIMPSRSIIIASVLSWPLILITLHDIGLFSSSLKKIHISLFNRHFNLKFGKTTQIVTALFLILLFLPSLYGYISFEQTALRGGFAHTSYFSDDFEALEWIDKNVSCDALILNDCSFTSRYLLSLSVKNLTFHALIESRFPKRARDLFMIWQNPRNTLYIIKMLRAYNVSYIFSTSEEGYLITSELERALLNDGEYHTGYFPKPYTPEKYAKIFDQYPFLKIVFASNSTRVYKVTNVVE